MNNEPVAWINKKGEFMPKKVDSFDIPLYTHPVKELTLTDEQINALDNEVKYSELSLYHHEYMRRFARLVLKKATNGEI